MWADRQLTRDQSNGGICLRKETASWCGHPQKCSASPTYRLRNPPSVVGSSPRSGPHPLEGCCRQEGRAPGRWQRIPAAGRRPRCASEPGQKAVGSVGKGGVRGRHPGMPSSAIDCTFPCGLALGLGTLNEGELLGAVVNGAAWLRQALLPALPDRRRLRGAKPVSFPQPPPWSPAGPGFYLLS